MELVCLGDTCFVIMGSELWDPWGDFRAWYSLLQPWAEGSKSFPEGPGVPLKGGSCSVCGHTRKKVMLLCSLSHTHLLESLFHLMFFPGENGAILFPQSSSLFIVIFCGWTTCLIYCLPIPQRSFSPTSFPSTSFSWLTSIPKLYLSDELDQSLTSTIPQMWMFKTALSF